SGGGSWRAGCSLCGDRERGVGSGACFVQRGYAELVLAAGYQPRPGVGGVGEGAAYSLPIGPTGDVLAHLDGEAFDRRVVVGRPVPVEGHAAVAEAGAQRGNVAGDLNGLLASGGGRDRTAAGALHA